MRSTLKTSQHARLRSWLPPALAAVLLCAALWVLHGELQGISYRDLQAALARLGARHLLLALLCCAANYLVLTCYDQLAFIYIGRRIARTRIALTPPSSAMRSATASASRSCRERPCATASIRAGAWPAPTCRGSWP